MPINIETQKNAVDLPIDRFYLKPNQVLKGSASVASNKLTFCRMHPFVKWFPKGLAGAGNKKLLSFECTRSSRVEPNVVQENTKNILLTKLLNFSSGVIM